MHLRFAHIADYAVVDASGKPTIVGIFDSVLCHADVSPIPFPAFYLIASFEASIAEGADHELEIAFVNDDEELVGPTLGGALVFRATGVGHPAQSSAIVGFLPGAIAVAAGGDYYFRFRVDGDERGRARVSVIPIQRPG
jgi:hypothetical protein